MIENDDWGIIDVKGSSLSYSGGLLYWCFYIGKNTKPDFFFNVGYDEYMKHVEGFYIVPNEDYVSKLGSIWTPYRGNSKWNIFREGEKEVRKLDRPFHTLKLEDCPVLRPY